MIGIIQGRLLPAVNGKLQAFPQGYWPIEFQIAKELGLECIEWVYDDYNNPLEKRITVDQMLVVSRKNRISINSICADFFVKYPLLRVTEYREDRINSLRWLVSICSYAGIKRVIVPFVDANAIHTQDELIDISTTMDLVCPMAQARGIEIHLETNLGAMDTMRLLRKVQQWDCIKICYDTGNSASMDRDQEEEWEAYGEDIGSIHIKDRLKGGMSVPLGSGNVKWDKISALIKKYKYMGDFILQPAREKDGEEVKWTKKNIEFLKGILS